MARRKFHERNIRSLTRNSGGNGYLVTLPINIVREWGWQHRQKLELTIDRKSRRIIIRDWEKRSKKKI